jgi:hypothetical protein
LTTGPVIRHPRERHGEPLDLRDRYGCFGGGARSWLVLLADLFRGGAWLAMVTILQDSH